MHRASHSRTRSWVSSAVLLSIFLTACSGHNGATPPVSGLVPQSNGARGAAIRSVATRIASGEEQLSAGGVRPLSTTPSNVTTADPPVPRPNGAPCVVQLFANVQFTNFTPSTFQYTPPPACPGPWKKVIFDGDFSVTAGRQFDRSGSVWIAGTNIYFGTTAEPSRTVSPSWHVERDVTDLSAILSGASTGEIILGNIVNGTYTGVITASGKLEFFPAPTQAEIARVPDAVYPLSGGALGDNQYLSTPSQPLTATYTFPRNVRAAYLDVFLQSQINDEFWYTCFPNDLAQKLFNCGNTAFREGDVALDGHAAGIAPVYPWIYTGGIDPYLWRPIPGVETLNFRPYRVNLTPFAALLADGNPHTITVNVFNDGNYFAANGALLVYLDHGSSQVTGGIISNATSLSPTPVVTENVTFNAQGLGSGPVSVTSTRAVSIDGYVNTSAGRVETQIQQQITFSNAQSVNANLAGTIFDQTIKQDTAVTSDTTTISGPGERHWVHETKDWPLNVVYDYSANADGSAVQTTSISQGKVEETAAHSTAGGTPFSLTQSNKVTSSDTLTFSASGTYAPSNAKSSQTYTVHSSEGYCYNKSVSAANGSLTSQVGGSC